MVIAAERTRDPKQPKRFEKNKNIDSRGVSQLQDSAQMANRFHGPLPILSWRRNNQPAFIRSKEDETNCHNWSNTFLFDQASPRDARRYAALVVGSWSGFVVVSPWLTIPVASIHILTASPKLAATRSAFAPSRNCSSAETGLGDLGIRLFTAWYLIQPFLSNTSGSGRSACLWILQ